MKNLFFTLLLAVFSMLVSETQAQTTQWNTHQNAVFQTVTGTQAPQTAQSGTVRIYENTNGIQNISPSREIQWQRTPSGITYTTYQYNNGLRSFSPSSVTTPASNGTYNTYQYNNGLRNIAPSHTIKP